MLTETIIEGKAAAAGLRPTGPSPRIGSGSRRPSMRVWDLLFARQQEALKGRAVGDFFRGLDVLRLSSPAFPNSTN